jgi:hypothetical protein
MGIAGFGERSHTGEAGPVSRCPALSRSAVWPVLVALRFLPPGCGEGDVDAEASAQAGVDGEAAVVGFGDGRDDGQAEAEAFGVGRAAGRPAPSGPRASGRPCGFIDPSADRCLCLKLAQVFVVQLTARSSAVSLIGPPGTGRAGMACAASSARPRSVKWPPLGVEGHDESPASAR